MPDRLRWLAALEHQLRQSIRQNTAELAPQCQFIAAFLVALLAERTISLAWIAQAMPTDAQPESNRKRIQRFLDDARATPCTFARIIATYLPARRWIVAIDRTNWFWGKTPLNLLVLAVVEQGVAIPLIWMPLPRDGASDTVQRIALLSQFLTLFGRTRIEYVIGDREFIGKDWIGWLHEAGVPFRLRLRCCDVVTDSRGHAFETAALFPRTIACRAHRFDLWGTPVYLGGKPLPTGDWLVIASSAAGPLLEDYRHRWKIECLFQALKGRGFRLEETRICQPRRLSALIGLLTLGYLWCVCVGNRLPETVCPSLGKSGRLRQSVCRRGMELVHRVVLGMVRQPTLHEMESAMKAFTPGKT